MERNSKKRDSSKEARRGKERQSHHNSDTSDHVRKGTQEGRQKYQPGLPEQAQKKEG
jgi:hypothetical protein